MDEWDSHLQQLIAAISIVMVCDDGTEGRSRCCWRQKHRRSRWLSVAARSPVLLEVRQGSEKLGYGFIFDIIAPNKSY